MMARCEICNDWLAGYGIDGEPVTWDDTVLGQEAYCTELDLDRRTSKDNRNWVAAGIDTE